MSQPVDKMQFSKNCYNSTALNNIYNHHTPYYRTWLLILLVFAIFAGGRATINLIRFYDSAIASGPNTVGEAGKIYYAKQFMNGHSIFSRGDSAPFYPSFHGALLHATVGTIGRLFDVTIYDLYYIGRALSVVFTFAALWVLILLLRRHGGNWKWSIAMVIVFFSATPLISHTISYRPDNWILFFSIFSAYILIVMPIRYYTLISLAIIPITAFFIKATGLYISIAVFLYLVIDNRLRDAFKYAVLTSALFTVVLAIMHTITNGIFIAGLHSGAQVRYSWLLSIQCLNVPQLWLFLILPPLIALHIFPVNTQLKKEQSVLFIFFIVAFIVGLLTSRRLGANSYYYLDSFAFGVVITISWFAHHLKKPSKIPHFQNISMAALVLLFILRVYPSTGEVQNLLHARSTQDIALYRTNVFKHDREKIEALCNQKDLSCFSDDAGLNVMFDKPQIIFPLVQSMLIQSGFLEMASMVKPIEKQTYDLIALTGSRWKYFNVNPVPQEFYEVLKIYYKKIETPLKYQIYKRKTIK